MIDVVQHIVGVSRVITEVQFKRSEAGRLIDGVIVGEFQCAKVSRPIVLMVVDVCPEHVFDDLDRLFRLTVSLWMVCRRHSQACSESLEEAGPEKRNKLAVPVRHNGCR